MPPVVTHGTPAAAAESARGFRLGRVFGVVADVEVGHSRGDGGVEDGAFVAPALEGTGGVDDEVGAGDDGGEGCRVRGVDAGKLRGREGRMACLGVRGGVGGPTGEDDGADVGVGGEEGGGGGGADAAGAAHENDALVAGGGARGEARGARGGATGDGGGRGRSANERAPGGGAGAEERAGAKSHGRGQCHRDGKGREDRHAAVSHAGGCDRRRHHRAIRDARRSRDQRRASSASLTGIAAKKNFDPPGPPRAFFQTRLVGCVLTVWMRKATSADGRRSHRALASSGERTEASSSARGVAKRVSASFRRKPRSSERTRRPCSSDFQSATSG